MKLSNIRDLEKSIKKQYREQKKLEKENRKLDKANAKILKQLKKERVKKQLKKFKDYMRTIKANIRKEDNKIKRQNIKFEAKEKELKVGKYAPIINYIITAYLYVEAKKNIDGEYRKDYNFGNGNKIQYDDDRTKKYTVCLIVNTQLTKNEMKYQEGIFYNDVDNGKPFIDGFINVIKEKDETVEDSINRITESPDIIGFKLINVQIQNINYVQPNQAIKKVMNDGEKLGINTKYTKYITNLKATSFKDLLQLEFNDYLKKNYRPNSCYLTVIINRCYDRFNRIDSRGDRRNKELTYDYLCELFEIPNKPSHNALSYQDVKDKFLSKFNFVSLYVYDCYMNLIFKHQATDKDNVSIRVMMVDDHIYELNNNLKSLAQKVDNEDDERNNIVVSNKYQILKPIEEEKNKELFLETEQDIIKQIIEQSQNEELQQLKIITPVNLNTILFKLVESGYIPKVNFHTQLYRISLIIKKLNVQILPADNDPQYGQLINFDSLEEYKQYEKAFEEFYQSIIKKEYLSDYHPSVLDIENHYKINPVMGYFDNYSSSPQNTIDENRAYTECLMSIKNIPIFNYFDVYRPYNNETIEDLAYYIIEVLDNDSRTAILFNDKYSRVFGYVLKQIKINYKILYVRAPLNVEEVNFENPVKELYSKPVKNDIKKAIVNIITGLLEKKQNKAELSKIFQDYNEANYYAIKYDGKLLPLLNEEMEFIETKSDFDDCVSFQPKVKSSKKLYLVSVMKKEQLINGFLPIKEMIYYNQRIKLLNMYDKMKSLNINITGIKTDCIMYDSNGKSKLKNYFSISSKIGEYKLEDNKYLVNKPIQINTNELVKPKLFDTTLKTFTNELDTKTINEFVKNNKQILIKGLFPGVGKSTLAKNFDNKSLFVCPYNKLCQVLRQDEFDSITYCKLFGLVGSDEEMKHIQEYDLSQYKTIVFDEIFLYEPTRLKRISQLMLAHPEKYFIATGDCDQRDPIGFKNAQYLTQCMNILFPTTILLNDIKRFKNDSDKKKVVELKKDIFNVNLSIEEICKKHNLNIVRKLSDVKTTTNICLFNFRCEQVNNHIHKNILKHKMEYIEGTNIICRKYEKKLKLNTNYTYKIVKINKKDITILDEVENKQYKISECILRNHFKLPYALTCDSVQGLSFGESDKITVFDSNTAYVDRKFLWTAITRARKLENVYIFIHPEAELERLSQSRIRLYFSQKVDSYKQQDAKAKRTIIKDEFVDEPWISSELEKVKYNCIFCKKNLELYIDENSNVKSNVTVDRKDNTKAHHKSNCQICCLDCNRKKGNRY